ncbi:hypothetical protein J6590_081199 [Homalodisca vitripennis]|nr:hypothetical protein J6590_081199 [Homalodisca vitripennis]
MQTCKNPTNNSTHRKALLESIIRQNLQFYSQRDRNIILRREQKVNKVREQEQGVEMEWKMSLCGLMSPGKFPIVATQLPHL